MIPNAMCVVLRVCRFYTDLAPLQRFTQRKLMQSYSFYLFATLHVFSEGGRGYAKMEFRTKLFVKHLLCIQGCGGLVREG